MKEKTMFCKDYGGKIVVLLALIAGLLVLANCGRMALGGAALPNPSWTETAPLTPLISYTIADFSPIIEFHGEAFPVKILATASMKTSLDWDPRMSQKGDYIGDTLSRDSFFEASTAGKIRWEEVKDKIFDEGEKDYQIIIISNWRDIGIMPISRY
jgi:hypothetical protein